MRKVAETQTKQLLFEQNGCACMHKLKEERLTHLCVIAPLAAYDGEIEIIDMESHARTRRWLRMMMKLNQIGCVRVYIFSPRSH